MIGKLTVSIVDSKLSSIFLGCRNLSLLMPELWRSQHLMAFRHNLSLALAHFGTNIEAYNWLQIFCSWYGLFQNTYELPGKMQQAGCTYPAKCVLAQQHRAGTSANTPIY